MEDINVHMINNVLSNWYRDKYGGGSYGTRVEEMYRTSSMQINGYCIPSRIQKSRGFLVDYFSSSGSIFMVVHNVALQGCG